MGRLQRWNAAAIAADREDHEGDDATVSGDAPGPIVQRVRMLATMPARQFRRIVVFLVAGIVVSQAIVGALAGQSRNVRAVVSGFSGIVVLLLIVALSLAVLGRYVRISVRTFRIIALVSAALLGFIMLTGAAVRLTGSGLGCPDWPTCKEGDIVPASGKHAAIEFGNRVVTGLCLLAAAVGVLTALVRRPYRRDLVRFGLIVSFGLFSNAILGGLTVIFDLQPQFVMSHFILAIACLAAGAVLFHRAGEAGPSGTILGRDRVSAVDETMRRLGNALMVGTLGIVFVGCLLTGSGPHGGDPEVRRFGYSMRDVVRVHSALVWLTVFLVIVMAARVWRATTVAAIELRRRIGVLTMIIVAQGGIGYWQWFTQVPALLVQVHILGAIGVWCGVLWVRAAITVPRLNAEGTVVRHTVRVAATR
jgi:cytochrome c oxidase assembly protein subunit 15